MAASYILSGITKPADIKQAGHMCMKGFLDLSVNFGEFPLGFLGGSQFKNRHSALLLFRLVVKMMPVRIPGHRGHPFRLIVGSDSD